MQMLSKNRTQRSAGHNDGPLGAERSAGADADCRRNRLEQRDLRLDTATPNQDRLNRLRHAVTSDLLRAEPGHHTDYQTSGDRRTQHQPPRVVLGSRCYQIDAEALVENQIGHHGEQTQQAPRRARRESTNWQCQRGRQQHPSIHREVCQSPRHDATTALIRSVIRASTDAATVRDSTSTSLRAVRRICSRCTVTRCTIDAPSAVNARFTADALVGLTARETNADMVGRAMSLVTDDTLTCNRAATAEHEPSPRSETVNSKRICASVSPTCSALRSASNARLRTARRYSESSSRSRTAT